MKSLFELISALLSTRLDRLHAFGWVVGRRLRSAGALVS